MDVQVWDIEQDRTADDGVKVVKGFEGAVEVSQVMFTASRS